MYLPSGETAARAVLPELVTCVMVKSVNRAVRPPRTSEYIPDIKATPRQPGVDEIRLPGERSQRERARLSREGLEIDRTIYDALLAVPRGSLPAYQD